MPKLDVTGNEIDHRLSAAFISDVHELDLFLGREKFRDPIAHRAEAGRDVFDAARIARQCQKIAIRRHAERGMRNEHVGRAAEIGDVGEVAHRIETDVLVHRRPQHVRRDAGDHQREAVRLRPCNRLGADEPAAADPVLNVELLAESGGECIDIEPAHRIGRAAGSERHHHSHRFARPFRGQRHAG
jgi:hypothetical protein